MVFMKEMKQFHKNCLKAFGILMLIACCFWLHLYKKLENYERTTQSGALNYYISLLQNRQYDRIYELSSYVETQFNPRETYIEYLKLTYEWRDLSQLTFREMYYSDHIFTYYDMLDEGKKIGTLMLRQADNGVTDYSVLVRIDNRNIYIETDQDVPLYVNGIALDDTYKTTEVKNFGVFDSLDDPDLAPQAARYHVDNLIDEAVVTTSDEAFVVVKDALKDSYYVGKKMSAQQQHEAQELLQTFSENYAKWTSEDGSFASVRQCVYRNTDLYDALASFNNQYFSLHDRVDFENWTFTDLAYLGEDGMIGTVSFDYVVYVKEERHVYQNTYQLSLMEFSGKWLVTSMAIANE